MEGEITRLVSDKGFGFIVAGDDDYFFHASGLIGIRFDELREGMTVTFEVGSDAKGPRAEDVRVETS